MYKNKFRTFSLSALMAISGLTTSCSFKQGSENTETHFQNQTTNEAVLEQQQNQDPESVAYYNYACDSILNTNGYYKYQDLLNKMSELDCNTKIDSLQKIYGLGGTIQQEFENIANQILQKFMQDISFVMSEHNIKLLYSFDSEYLYFGKDKNNYHYKQWLYYTGIPDEEWSMNESEWIQVKSSINKFIDDSGYDTNRRNDIKTQVLQIINKTKNSLTASRKSVENKYSDYYFSEEPDKICIEQKENGSYEYGYDNLNQSQEGDEDKYDKYLISTREIYVYTPNLSIDFFDKDNKKCQLVSLNDTSWQIIKTLKNGKTEKSPVFVSKPKYDEQHTYSAHNKTGKSFTVVPGYEIGVHIIETENKIIGKRKKDWQMPAKIVQQMHSLQKEKNKIQKIKKLKNDKYNEAQVIADSLTTQRFGPKTR